MKKSPLTSPRLRRIRRRRIVIQLFLLVFFFGALGYGLVWLSKRPFLTINNVTVVGAQALDEKVLTEQSQKFLEGKYVYVFPKANRFIYPKEKILSNAYAAFNRIERIDTEVDGQTLVMTVKERQPQHVWCAGAPDARAECYFVDATGYVFAEAPTFSGPVYVELYGLLHQEENLIGSQYLTPEEFRELNDMIVFFKDNQIPVKAITTDDKNVHEAYLAHGLKVLFTREQDKALLRSSLNTLLSNTRLLGKDAGIEYVDLRFGSKVYYKRIGEVGDNIVQEEE